MTRGNRTVTWMSVDASRLPDWASEGVALIADLERRGFLGPLAERLRIRREGGYCGIDVFVFLLYFFSSRLGVGIKTWWYRARVCKVALAALAGRTNLASSTSVARALDAVDAESMRAQYRWMLFDVAGAEPVLRHPSVLSRDATGRGWQVFDFDGTVHAIRHRALPEGDDLPEGHRRSELMSAPGYTGRKRGDVQVYRATLQHSGSGLWLYASMAPGNGDHRADLAGALDTVVATCARIEHPLSHALIRVDGAYGWVPDFTACREREVPFCTRLTRPELFTQPDFLQRLLAAEWVFVPDSGGGPRRSAAELGLVTVHAGDGVVRNDGTPYEPVEVRVVVSRFERDKKAQRGRVIEGWQYELFVIDAPADAWPAAETVALYFGRTAEENRFCQEDKELVLDRIFSYELAGQEFATHVGLMVWNLRVACGFDLDSPPVDVPQQTPRVALPDTRRVPPATVATSEPTSAKRVEDADADVDVVSTPDPTGAREQAIALLDGLDWQLLLAGRPGWRWMTGRGELRCPDNQALTLSFVDLVSAPPGRARVHFAGRASACDGCELRSRCFSSSKPRAAKMINITVGAAEATRLDGLLKLLPRQGRMRQRALPKARSATPQRMWKGPPIRKPPVEVEAGPLAATVSLFLPAAARRVFLQATMNLTTHVHVHMPPALPRLPTLVAPNEAARRHSRLTWTERVARYALPHDAKVDVTYAGPPILSTIVGGNPLATARLRAG